MKLLSLVLTLLFISLFSACSSDKEQLQVDTNLTAYSEDVVKLKASGALAYTWRQVSGTDVILVDANSATASFIAPSVSKEESLVFELEAVTTQIQEKNFTLKKQVRVTVLPRVTADMDSTSGEVEPEPITTTTQEINSSTKTTPTTPTNNTQTSSTLKSLKLTIEKTSLNIDESTTLKVVATYSDNTTKDVTNQVEWIYADKLALDIKNNILKTNHKDTNILLQAKYKNKTSNKVALEIYKEINGHRLPPEPNPAINNATLLGVDTNDNGVRDDVERWIYEEYKEKHPVHIDIAMQAGRAYKKVLETPERALEIHDEVRAFRHCQAYYSVYAKYFNEPVVVHENIYSRYFRHKIYFNTQERMDAYLQYDKLLSGGVYTLPSFEEEKAACDFNTSKYEE
jgi:hypothetical protein